MKSFLLVAFSLVPTLTLATTPIHRLAGYYERNGNKFAVCISLFESFWFSRGITAFNGNMTFATQYLGEVPLSPPGFGLSGNKIDSNGSYVFAVFDPNNSSLSNPDLMVKETDMELRGHSLETLQLHQNGQITKFILRTLKQNEECLLSRPK